MSSWSSHDENTQSIFRVEIRLFIIYSLSYTKTSLVNLCVGRHEVLFNSRLNQISNGPPLHVYQYEVYCSVTCHVHLNISKLINNIMMFDKIKVGLERGLNYIGQLA